MSFLPDITTDALPREAQAARDAVVPFIGERAVSLFAFAVADENGGELWSAFLRRELVASGEDPERPQVTEAEQVLIDWARLMTRDPRAIDERFTAQLERLFSPQLRALLVGFAAQLIAADFVVLAGRVPMDPALAEFRKPDPDYAV